MGEKKLVRIEEAGRTSATAVLTGADAEAAAEAAGERAKTRSKSDERARRSAAAKKGAARRKARQEAEKATEVDAVETLADDARRGRRRHRAGQCGRCRGRGEAEAPASRRGGRSRRRGKSGGNGNSGENGFDDAEVAPEEGPSGSDDPPEDAEAEASRGRRRRAILSPSAPRPQRRTAPFACEGPGRRRSPD